MKDVEMFDPKFIRIERANEQQIIFDCVVGQGYYARDVEKYGILSLEKYLKTIKHEKGIIAYHISVRCSDNINAFLVFESDEDGGDEVIKKLAKLVKDKGVKFILKESGNRSLHLLIPVDVDDEEEYNLCWNSVFYLLGERDRKYIDTHLCNLNGQIRGFYSLHLKTYRKGKVIENE